MDSLNESRTGNWVASLRVFLGVRSAAAERCELCGAEIGHEHAHLIEPTTRRLLCACQPCAILFASSEAKRYRRVPRDARRLTGFNLGDAQWDAFQIPINMAFFFRSSAEGRVLCMYPGPAGATESTLDLTAWDDLVAANPVLQTLQDDVEALLVYRVQGAREHYRVPIDSCYELVGQIRTHWHGLSGGEGVREAIRGYFAGLRERATAGSPGVAAHA
ncbi:MAG: DUF5947 family protein [Rhodanobacteraceae bacterium]